MQFKQREQAWEPYLDMDESWELSEIELKPTMIKMLTALIEKASNVQK
jgi:hypothetical protein